MDLDCLRGDRWVGSTSSRRGARTLSSMAGPLADGVTAPELRGATESHHQQQALVLTVCGGHGHVGRHACEQAARDRGAGGRPPVAAGGGTRTARRCCRWHRRTRS